MNNKNLNDNYIEKTSSKQSYRMTKGADGRNIVIIDDIRFRGKRNINWNEVDEYLKRYIGDLYTIVDSEDVVYIGKDFPDEYTGSNDTARLKGALAKAKANAAQGLPQLIEYASNKRYKENLADKHKVNAKLGWYRFTTRFALPVFDENSEIDRFNIYRIEVLIRQEDDGKMYLYDLVNIKKETSTPLES